jgi:hypothetical protein
VPPSMLALVPSMPFAVGSLLIAGAPDETIVMPTFCQLGSILWGMDRCLPLMMIWRRRTSWADSLSLFFNAQSSWEGQLFSHEASSVVGKELESTFDD